MLRGTLDLRSKKGAFVFVRVGRGGTAALSAPLDILARRMLNGGDRVHPGVAASFYGATAAGVSPTIAADAAQADTVRNKADCFAPTWFEGGCVWELIVDYSAQSTGDSVTVEALYQTQEA